MEQTRSVFDQKIRGYDDTRDTDTVDNPCIDIVNNLHDFSDLNGDGEISSNDLIETVQRLMWPHQNECIDTAEAEHVARIVSFHTAWCKSR